MTIVSRNDFNYIHLFRTEKHFYCYDAHTNAIIKLDQVTWQTLKTGQLNPEKIEAGLERKYIDLLSEVLVGGGLEFGGGPSSLRTSWQHEDLESMLGSRLTQLTLVVSETCNLRCTYCMYGKHYPTFRAHSSRCMSREVAELGINFFLERCDKNEPITIGFYGGEPLINFKLIDHCLEYVRQRFSSQLLGFHMTTNGILLDLDMIEVLQNNNVVLTISLDGPRNIHNRCRHTKDGIGTYYKVMRNLRLIQKHYPDYYRHNILFSIVLAPETDLYEVYRFFCSGGELLQGHRLLVSFVRPYATTIFEELGSTTGIGIEKIESRFVEKAEDGTLVNDFFLRDLIVRPLSVIHKRRHWNGFQKHMPPNGICLPGRRKILVETNGDIKFCERIGTDQNIGSIYRGFDFHEIWDIVQQYLKISTEDCIECWAIRLCKMCFAHAYQGKIDGYLKKQLCSGNRANISADLQIYCQSLERNANAFNFIK
jgi:uncharacterized protein